MSGRRRTILLVEDSPTQALRLRDLLEEAGYAVRWATGLRTAEEELGDARPDLIISDYHLPEVSGAELCRRLRLRLPLPMHLERVTLRPQGLHRSGADTGEYLYARRCHHADYVSAGPGSGDVVVDRHQLQPQAQGLLLCLLDLEGNGLKALAFRRAQRPA